MTSQFQFPYVACVRFSAEGLDYESTKHDTLDDAMTQVRSAYRPYAYTIRQGSRMISQFESVQAERDRKLAEAVQAQHEARYRAEARDRVGIMRGFTND